MVFKAAQRAFARMTMAFPIHGAAQMSRFKYAGGMIFAMAMLAGSASAAIVDRGGGMLYDDVLRVTWLQDANFARTSGYSVDGRMAWPDAKVWAENLVFGGFSDWRLARNSPVNGVTWNHDYSVDGLTDFGYNITSPNSELAYMFHVNLGLKSRYAPVTSADQPDFGVFRNGTMGGAADVGLVKNLESDAYWSGTLVERSQGSEAWAFATGIGNQGTGNFGANFFSWAVRDGDVAIIPLPSGFWLFASGIVMIIARRHPS
jgi:hypothetical protein